jgi:hypothetical protein
MFARDGVNLTDELNQCLFRKFFRYCKDSKTRSTGPKWRPFLFCFTHSLLHAFLCNFFPLLYCIYIYMCINLSPSFSLSLSFSLDRPLRKGGTEREERTVAGRWRKAREKSGARSQKSYITYVCVCVCIYIYLVYECPHANIDYERQRRKTNQLRESASIIAGVAAVRNASRKPDVDGRWSGTGSLSYHAPLYLRIRALSYALCSILIFQYC